MKFTYKQRDDDIALQDLISEGEHQTQDFKFAVNDSKKIARSLSAFANTDGGRLLLGVKDNGRIVGVESDEEYYMIESAATLFCKPSVNFETYVWEEDGKTVLEINVPKSDKKPHKAPDKDGNYKVYVRVNDQNLLANSVLLKVWEQQKRKKGTLLKLNNAEEVLLKYLTDNPQITMREFQDLAGINRWLAEKIIVNLMVIDVVGMDLRENECLYFLKKKKKKDEI